MKNIYKAFCACLLLFTSHTIMAQVPILNSLDTARAVIFLDFDGHLVEGTSWNYESSFVCDGANLNSTQVTEIFNRVAEDYRPFNVNITTDSSRYWAAPARKRMRVVLTTSSSWYGSAGGVAFTNSFTWGDNTPCFVFTALLNYNVKFISEATSHEAGHTLGLNHQSSYDAVCNKTAEYNSGKGSGEISWAPIMGVGYYRNLSLWHYGSNPFGCSYLQDDLGIITSAANGISFRTDDHGGTALTATRTTIVNNQFAVNGILERPSDADVFMFSLNSRRKLQLEALPFSATTGLNGANIDMQVELTTGDGTVIGIYNPESSLRVNIDTVLQPGIYQLRILSRGNVNAPGFATLGSYTVTANMAAITLPLHKLELKATAENNRHKLDWEIIADENIVEQTIEIAADGFSFQPLAAMASNSRSYVYQTTKAGLLYYRMKVAFDNGRTHYSNVTTLRSNATTQKPHLVGNVVSSLLTVNNTADFAYTILDLAGRQVAKGKLTQGLNRIAASHLTSGLYLIHYTNQLEQHTEKFMKQ